MSEITKFSFNGDTLTTLKFIVEERLIREKASIEAEYKGDEERIKKELELATVNILKDLNILSDVQRCTYLSNASVEQKLIMSGATHTQKLLFVFSRELNNNSDYRYNMNLTTIQIICDLIFQILTFTPPKP